MAITNIPQLQTQDAQRRVTVTSAQLPLHCPMPGSSLWNSHPRVYIPLDKAGASANCPYCGTLYMVIAAE